MQAGPSAEVTKATSLCLVFFTRHIVDLNGSGLLRGSRGSGLRCDLMGPEAGEPWSRARGLSLRVGFLLVEHLIKAILLVGFIWGLSIGSVLFYR